MPVRYHAHRRHIISSLDTLLYQLHTLSFLLAPSLLAYLCRCATQFQFSQTREVDGHRSLKFWYFMVLLINAGSVWSHAAVGYPEGRGVVLDFIGIGQKPSKSQLLLLDFTIIFLQAVLATIAYETSLSSAFSDTPDPLIPNSPSPLQPPTTEEQTSPLLRPPSPSASTSTAQQRSMTYPPTPAQTPPLHASSSRSPLSQKQPEEPIIPFPPPIPVINLRFRHVIHRLTRPAPELAEEEAFERQLNQLAMQLPLPNTTTARLTETLRLLSQTRTRLRQMERNEEAQRNMRRGGSRRNAPTRANSDIARRSEGEASRSTRIPGAIEDEGSDSDLD